MKNIILLITIVMWGVCVLGQTTIQGKVLDKKGNPVPLANVYLEGILDGGTTNAQGVFSFTTQAKNKVILIFSRMGYEGIRQPLDLNTLSEPVSASYPKS